jgi:hypothetical protein
LASISTAFEDIGVTRLWVSEYFVEGRSAGFKASRMRSVRFGEATPVQLRVNLPVDAGAARPEVAPGTSHAGSGDDLEPFFVVPLLDGLGPVERRLLSRHG